jgi:hypothetical protein
MTTAASHNGGTSLRRAPSNVVGVVLFVAWGIALIIWVASTINLAADGDSKAIITAVATIVLLFILAVAEGLEVAVIACWKVMYPDRSESHLAGWLAARQLFVALIVTTATLLANRPELYVPGFGSFDEEVPVRGFDIFFVGLGVLYFAQILPKHLAATNPDRYLSYTRRVGFTVVAGVDKSGIPRPGAWTASALERALDWRLTAAEEMQEAARPQPDSLDHIWRELIPERPAGEGAEGSPRESERSSGT